MLIPIWCAALQRWWWIVINNPGTASTLINPEGASRNAMEPEPAPAEPVSDAPVLSDDEKRVYADQMEALMLAVDDAERDWVLQNHLDYERLHTSPNQT